MRLLSLRPCGTGDRKNETARRQLKNMLRADAMTLPATA